MHRLASRSPCDPVVWTLTDSRITRLRAAGRASRLPLPVRKGSQGGSYGTAAERRSPPCGVPERVRHTGQRVYPPTRPLTAPRMVADPHSNGRARIAARQPADTTGRARRDAVASARRGPTPGPGRSRSSGLVSSTAQPARSSIFRKPMTVEDDTTLGDADRLVLDRRAHLRTVGDPRRQRTERRSHCFSGCASSGRKMARSSSISCVAVAGCRKCWCGCSR